MTKKQKKRLNLDEYVDIGKWDIVLYAIITIILLIISLFIAFKYNFYYHIPFVGIFMLLKVLERVETYITLKQIKNYLIDNDLLEEIGCIDYWNDKYYFLTDNYMIIKQKKTISSFKYSEIVRIFKENDGTIGKHSSLEGYLHIITTYDEYKVLTYSTLLVNEDYRDISDYLLEKNPNIKVGKIFNNIKVDVLKVYKK